MAGNYWDRITKERMSRRRVLRTGAGIGLGAGALSLIGCGDDDDEPTPSATNTQTSSGSPSTGSTPTPGAAPAGKRGGVYGHYFATVGNYNVVAFYHDGYNNSGVAAYDRFLTATLDSRGYVLQAAESVEIADPVTVVFKMKPGMKTHNLEPVNGRPITAADIVATQEYVTQLPNAENSGFQRTRMEGVEATDDNTVVYHMKAPYAYLFASTALANPTAQPIIPQEMLDVLDTHPAVGSGPYQLESHTFGAEYTYKRFEEWHGAEANGAPYFDGIFAVSLTDPVAQETAFRGEQIHEWNPPGAQIDRLLNELDESKFKSLAFLATGLNGFNANMNATLGGPRPWHDVRVREAFYRLTNRQQWIDLVLDGKAVVPPGPMHASLEVYQLDPSETEEFFKEDVEAAKQLLEAANYDTGSTWIINTSNTAPANAQMAEVWAQQLSRAGIQVRIEPIPLAELLPQKMQPATFDLFVGGQPGGDTPFRAIRNQHSDTTDQFNNVGLFDPEIDAMIEASEAAVDRDENIRLVKQIQMEVLKRYSLSYIVSTAQTYHFYNARLQNHDPDPLVGQTYRTQEWFA